MISVLHLFTQGIEINDKNARIKYFKHVRNLF